MDTRETLLESDVIVVGKADESSLIERLTSDDPEQHMPPPDRPALKPTEIEVLRAWVDQGLPWTEGFTFVDNEYNAPLEPRRPDLPPVVDGRENPIDRIIDNYFQQQNVTRPDPIDDAAFLRRVFLDLSGMLPSRAQLESFIKDPSSNKRQLIIDQLLADDRTYAEHWLTFWNDLLRNDYIGTGYIDGGRKQITAWLYEALRTNKPYDQFVRELMHATPDTEGFINGIQWRGNVNASQRREIQFSQNVSQVFLGINMKCASCHDSFIDHWKLDQAYGLGAVYSKEPLEIHRCDKPTGKIAKPGFVFPELGKIDESLPQPERLKQLADLLTDPRNGRLSRTIVNRLWQRLMGRGIVHPVDAMGTRPWNQDLLDYLAVHLVDNHYDLKATLRLIANSAAYQSQCIALEQEQSGPYVFHGPQAKRMTAEQFVDAIWSISGTAPQQIDAPITWDPNEGRQVRAALVKCDLLMRSLGRPNREQVVTSRPSQLTTLEAIDLANGQIMSDTLRRGATLMIERQKSSPEEFVRDFYWRAMARDPSGDELTEAMQLVGDPLRAEGVEDLLWSVFMLPEFQLVR